MSQANLSKQATVSRAQEVLLEAGEQQRLDVRDAGVFILGAAAGLAVGCMAGMLLAPLPGRLVRRRAVDQANHLYHVARHGGDTVSRRARFYRHRMFGLMMRLGKAIGLLHENVFTDQDLANKIRSHLGRIPNLDLGNVLVDCAGGVCTLRGHVPDPIMIQRVERAAAKVSGVARVNNMLHQLVSI